MAKFIEFETFDLISKVSGRRFINVENIIEIEDLTSYDNNPLTRIKISNNDFFDTRRSVSDIIALINK